MAEKKYEFLEGIDEPGLSTTETVILVAVIVLIVAAVIMDPLTVWNDIMSSG